MLAATLTFARSAKVAFAWATAAQPPSSLNPESLNSFTHISAHLGCPSSEVHRGCSRSLSGLRMPTMMVTTLDNVGLPFTESLLPSFTTEYTPVGLKSPLTYRFRNLSKLSRRRESRLMSMLFSRGQMS